MASQDPSAPDMTTGSPSPSRTHVDDGRWLRVEDVVADTQLSPVTIRRALRKGRLRGVLVGNKWRTRTAWVRQWLEALDPFRGDR
jgi:excisionase family DNA binding protein